MRIVKNILASALLVLSAVSVYVRAEPITTEYKMAVFAGGCFWCMEPPFDKLDGVIATTSGYIGGSSKTAVYKTVSAGGSGHFEALQVKYDPARVSYALLLDVFWRNVDPFDRVGQFCDKGDQYLSAIFYRNEEEKILAEISMADIAERLAVKSASAIATQVLAAKQFYPAEDYHQNYYQRNPIRYKYYRNACGRDKRLERVWGER
ncbi:MAG: peptide-methionine (S)-S-oxide reductase [Lentisphaeria bacterium]|jgi:peptide-methionine (S)-S-oxide reductase